MSVSVSTGLAPFVLFTRSLFYYAIIASIRCIWGVPTWGSVVPWGGGGGGHEKGARLLGFGLAIRP